MHCRVHCLHARVGRGRVFVSGAEWAAEIEGAAPPVGESVVVEAVDGARLRVRGN